MTKLKPVVTPVKEENGRVVSFEPDETHLLYQTLYCCPQCRGVAVGGWAFLTTITVPNHRHEKCPKCDSVMDWDAVDEDDKVSEKAFDDWFNANAVDGSLTMLNEQGTGYLQKGEADEA